MLNIDSMRLDHGQIEVIDEEVAGVLRKKTAAERIGIGFEMWISARDMLTSHLGETHPEWDSKRVRKEVAGRLSRGTL